MTAPFTMTRSMPAAGRVGASKVARSRDRLRIEDDEIGVGAGPYLAAIGEPEPGGGEARHAAHRILEGEEAELARIVAEHAREGAPKPRVRVAVVGKAVRADHGVLVGHDAANVRLVHHEVDGARGLERFRGGDRVEAEFARDLGKVAARRLRVRLGPGDDHLLRVGDHLREQHRRARGVGVDVEADGLGLARPVDEGEGLAAAAEVPAPGALVVGDDDARAGAAADLERFLERPVDAVLFVSHVRDIEPARGARDLGDGGHLVGGRGPVGAVDEPGAEADGARLHALGEPLAHGVDLRGGGRAVDIVHGVETERGVTYEEGGVGRGRHLAQGRHVVGEARKAEVRGRAEEVERRRHGAAGPEGRHADAAVPGDDGGDALAGLRGHVAIDEEEVVVVGVRVDEAGGDDAPRRVDGARGRRRVELAADRGDALARDGDVGAHARRPRPVDHRPALEENVVLLLCPGHRLLPLFRVHPWSGCPPPGCSPGAAARGNSCIAASKV